MKNRRLVRIVACALAALGVLVVPALADELIGRITAVNVAAKTLTVKEKGTDKDVEVKVTDETIVEKGKGKSGKVDLAKMQKAIEKSKRGGIAAEITHENGTASKIVYKGMPKKKDAPASQVSGKQDNEQK